MNTHTHTESFHSHESVEISQNNHSVAELASYKAEMETTTELKDLSKSQKAKIYKTKRYKETYNRIISEDMDMPRSDWKDIKNIPHAKIIKLVDQIATDEYFELKTEKKREQYMKKKVNLLSKKEQKKRAKLMVSMVYLIGPFDYADLVVWLLNPKKRGKKFLKGNYKDLDDFVVQESLLKKS